MHRSSIPLNVPAVGGAETVTVRVAIELAHPPVPATVYVIVAVPEAIPITSPVEGLILAIEVLFDDQVPPKMVEEKRVALPTHTSCRPLSMPAFGGAVTVTVRVETEGGHPPLEGSV